MPAPPHAAHRKKHHRLDKKIKYRREGGTRIFTVSSACPLQIHRRGEERKNSAVGCGRRQRRVASELSVGKNKAESCTRFFFEKQLHSNCFTEKTNFAPFLLPNDRTKAIV
jgi:hypothetical protein